MKQFLGIMISVKKLLTVLLVIVGIKACGQNMLDFGTSWKYLKGNEFESSSLAAWNQVNFNDDHWNEGNAPFRYGDGQGGTVLEDMRNRYSTVFLRQEINIEDTLSVDEMEINVNFDDGFTIWLDNEEVLSVNAPDDKSSDAVAPENHESGEVESYTVNTKGTFLDKGTHIFSVQMFNVSLTSSDVYFDASIRFIQHLPEATPPEISHASGFYTEPFEVTISGQEGETIFYTLNGNDPLTETAAFTGVSPINILIDPDFVIGRGITPGVVLRASTTAKGFSPSKSTSRTYLFKENVRHQKNPGLPWPQENPNNQIMDYEMDSEVVNSMEYNGLIDKALTAIPSISLVTDMNDLFHHETGIYVNASNRGRQWERPVSVTLINVDGTSEFEVDAGLRIRGGYSRNHNNPKHAFRLFFRNEYGPGKLDYPLFGEEGVNRFDNVDLRTSQNYSWSFGGSNLNIMNRDVFSRDLQCEMHQGYTRSRYYHLYLNGLYWGLFQSQERAEASFSASYFGGKSDDYDVVKVGDGYNIEATDGSLGAWEQIWDLCNDGFDNQENYYRLIGYNKEGKRDPSLPVLVDLHNLIDYMLVIFYAGNFDAPVSSFLNNHSPNNFYCTRNRKMNTGFRFFAHDAEHTLLRNPAGPGRGIEEDRVNLAYQDNNPLLVSGFNKFHPQWLHHKLTDNADYRMLFADHVYKHFFGEGALTANRVKDLFEQRAMQIEMAIIAESARWGDSKSGQAFTKDDWEIEINNLVRSYFTKRGSIVLDQLMDADLYPKLLPPKFSLNKKEITHHFIEISIGETIGIDLPDEDSYVFYTLDGSDPRKSGGEIGHNIIYISENESLLLGEDAVLKARTYNNGVWSALAAVFVTIDKPYNPLRFSEIHYNPPDFIQGKDTTAGGDLEFIEIKNIGLEAYPLGGCVISGGINYSFSNGTMVQPGEIIVLASNEDDFEAFYNQSAFDEYNGKLSNGGENIILENKQGEVIFNIEYGDDNPWPKKADGDGYSLVPYNYFPSTDFIRANSWKASAIKNGSPGMDDPETFAAKIIEPEQQIFDISVYPNPAKSLFNISITGLKSDFLNISLHHIDGRLLWAEKLSVSGMESFTKEIQLQENLLAPGIYLLNVTNNQFINTKRLIIQ